MILLGILMVLKTGVVDAEFLMKQVTWKTVFIHEKTAEIQAL